MPKIQTGLKKLPAKLIHNNITSRFEGGGEKSSYKVSVGYLDEQGTTIGTNLKKINIGTAFDYVISSKLKFQSDIMYTRYDQDANYDYEDWGGYVNEKSLRTMAYRKMPNLSVYVRDTNNKVYPEYFTPYSTLQGSAKDIPNPVAFAKLATHKRYKDNVRAGFTLNYQVNEKLTANSIVTLDVFDSKMEKFLPYKAIGADYGDDFTNKATNQFDNKSSIFNMTKLIYSPMSGDLHDMKVLAQFDAEITNERAYRLVTSHSFSPDDITTVGEKNQQSMSASSTQFRSVGFFLNDQYKFKDKYILSIGAKIEANSKYSRQARWGFFPAANLAWRISEEPFLKGFKFIDDFRLRGSWGITGNSPDKNYLYFNTYTAGTDYNYLDMKGVKPNNMELTNLKWENIEQYNIGFSFYGIKNRLNIEFDVYEKTTKNLYLTLYETNIPNSTGFERYATNDGKMLNKGIEFSIDYKVIDREDFDLSFNFNISHNKNVILQLPKTYTFEYGNMLENGNYKVAVVPGQASGGFFGYKYLGVYSREEDTYVRDANGNLVYNIGDDKPLKMIHTEPDGGYYEFEAGDAKYEDRNHDGKIDELDIAYLGDTNPLFMGGFGPRVSYKNFTVNFFVYYRVGYEIINQTRMDTEKMYGYDNQSKATNWRWRSEGDETDMPRALYNYGYNWLGSSRFVEDGTFIRFKSASISYDFPKETAKKLKFNDIKVYLTGYNLYTWTRYTGQDPEVGLPSNPKILPKDYSRTPPTMRYTLGISLTF